MLMYLYVHLILNKEDKKILIFLSYELSCRGQARFQRACYANNVSPDTLHMPEKEICKCCYGGQKCHEVSKAWRSMWKLPQIIHS